MAPPLHTLHRYSMSSIYEGQTVENAQSGNWPLCDIGRVRSHTVSFHNFKSQNFKLSVSNPKSKYVAYLSVLSQISNCQGLGRKNKHDFFKTDRRTSKITHE